MVQVTSLRGHVMAPLAGKPDELAGEVTRMQNVAVTIEKLVKLLEDVESGRRSKSQKVDKLKKTAGEAKNALAKAKEIYKGTGAALRDYQRQLDTSVTDAKKAYKAAIKLKPELDRAKTAYDNALSSKHEADNRTTSSKEEEDNRKKDAETAQANVTSTHKTYRDLDAAMRAHQKAWDTAKDDLDDAARVARGKIQTAIDKSPAKDSWWDNLAGFFKALSNILGWVALVVGIVALFCTGPLGLLLVAVATAASVASLALDASLALGGKGSWTTVLLDGVGLLPFGKLLKGGKLTERMARMLKGPMEDMKDLKYARPKNWKEFKAAADDVVDRAKLSNRGNTAANRVASAEEFAGSGPSRWNAWQSLKHGGTATGSKVDHLVHDLPRINNRMFKNEQQEAMKVLGDRKGDALGGAESLIKKGWGVEGRAHGVATGQDWLTNKVAGWASSGPSNADLKARVMSPYMDGMPVPAGR